MKATINHQQRTIKFAITVSVIGVITILAIFGLSIATFVKVDQGFTNQISTVNTSQLNSVLAQSIRIQDVMKHLQELQRIATINNGTRAAMTPGYNETLDYIENILAIHTNYHIKKTFFPVRQFSLDGIPSLASFINGISRVYKYSANPDTAEFYHIFYSTSANFTDFIELTVIPELGCSDENWHDANPSPMGRVALVKRGSCFASDKASLAIKFNASALLIYNDGSSLEYVPPYATYLAQENYIPALFLSWTVGNELATAAQNPLNNVSILLTISVKNLPPSPEGNICADTPTGDVTQTIVVGSHSDSVPDGPGINDNGSGSAANLELALTLARLFETSTYAKYKYRVRFCWWGAEEVDLLGADFHVKQAKISTTIGERLTDYLVNLNYDMLGSPNYIFGIYDGKTANNDTPVHALAGTNKLTTLFREWFDKQKLPWTDSILDGLSDYEPFLTEGIVVSGLFSGANDKKSVQERSYYDKMLGQGLGGIADVIHDPCYHKDCDSLENINTFVFEKMVQAAAYVLEYLGQHEDLKTWLYPNGRPVNLVDKGERSTYRSKRRHMRKRNL